MHRLRKQELYDLQCKITEGKRVIRDSKRELAPLTVGLVANVKKERTLRLRDQIRKRDRGSTKMQVQ